MIRSVTSNQPSFKTVKFTPGFNVVMADRTKDSTKKDSRNGLGKTTLIEIIHFCLGSDGATLSGAGLEDWSFTMELTLGGGDVQVTRSIAEPKKVVVDGSVEGWPVQPRLNAKTGEFTLDTKDWIVVLGHLMFGLPPTRERSKYKPTFRSLITYFARRGRDAFSTPFEHYRKQNEWDKQVHIAFLLNLAWEDARDVQLLRDKEKGLKDLKNAVKAGVVAGYGSLGDLEDKRIRLEEQAKGERERLDSFKVHVEYRQIQTRADQLTRAIHDFANKIFSDRQLVALYERDMSDEAAPEQRELEAAYAEAGIIFGDLVRRRLDEVASFHQAVVTNRRDFLSSEAGRLKAEIYANEEDVRRCSDERAGLMGLLQTHGALEEYTGLQRLHLDTIAKVNEVKALIENTKRLTSGMSELKIERELLHQRGRRDYEDRGAVRAKAVNLFNSNSQFLYDVPGRLIIDFLPKGFNFSVEIERDGSEGIENMKIFCFDIMLAQLWSARKPSPGLLLHDSRVFEADSRQRALALELAARESIERGFQYICTLNSDMVPTADFSEGFNLSDYVRLTLTDDSADGCLLGMRF